MVNDDSESCFISPILFTGTFLKQNQDCARGRIFHVRTVYSRILFILINISITLEKSYSVREINLSTNICFEAFTTFIEPKAAFLSK